LDGRDGESLKEWLRNNKHIKIVTRDRASAYASAISEILPEAIQVADRFHLYQNLMESVKEALKVEFPEKIKIDNVGNAQECIENESVKKRARKNKYSRCEIIMRRRKKSRKNSANTKSFATGIYCIIHKILATYIIYSNKKI
jgi:transposase